MTHAALPSPVLEIEACGAVTALGHDPWQTLAGWVAQARGLRRVRLEGLADPFTVAECAALTAGLQGAGRLLRLLQPALAQALASAGPEPGPLYLVLPEWLDEAGAADLAAQVRAVLPACCRQVDLYVLRAGSTGAWTALELAFAHLDAQPGLHHIAIAAVDSLCEPTQLRRAATAGRLYQAGHGEGLVAGEAAACVALRRRDDITQVPAGRMALHRPASVAALAEALRAALAGAGMQGRHLSHLLSDHDGSAWRAAAESEALMRSVFADAGARPQWRPATLWGQTGCAGGVLGWLLPAASHAHGLERINTVLGWGLDCAGPAAAGVLERSPH